MSSPFLTEAEKAIFNRLHDAQTKLSLNAFELPDVIKTIAEAKAALVEYIVENRAKENGL